ncbi:CRISPR-associated helicase/endonuclease Cas3 [Bacillus tuaregi]|uniref:CRISPR-associated helicase/endonuclease Cas3 n=1 Tax=Bacillus tuaregi TaxID=1816695 RepID=UPI0008F88E0D|nr:CRISPR-associated helicase/endonuclease Cas3 [Bacillus tuaregi]
MNFIAHIRESDNYIQSVKDHLLKVKELAELYGESMGVKHLAGLAGMLHDLGKYTIKFRDYILEAVHNPDTPPKRGSVDHSTAGGKLLFDFFHSNNKHSNLYKALLSEVIGNAIISHHSYIHDFLSPDLQSKYLNRVKDKKLEEFDFSKRLFFEQVISEKEFQEYVTKAAFELESFLAKESPENNEKQLMFLTKFIFSALIDADRTNTRLFEEGKQECSVIHYDKLFKTYYERLMEKVESFKHHSNAHTPINRLRTEMSDLCEQFAVKPSGIYTLSIPTGGGKTLASLRYALKHAQLYQKKHIIYVVPYTTIIEQNAEEVRNILKDDANILEHHSNVIEDVNVNDEDLKGYTNIQRKLKLAKDNWDSPIIFTTMVQFLNAFYANGSRNIRRLHNLTESVIIFDEVQKVPIKCLSLFNQAVNFLKTYGQSSMILCTATQPALDFVKHKLDINPGAEMIHHLDHVIEAFRRVEIIDKATEETFNNEKLASFIEEIMEAKQSVLVILNTKTVVKNLYMKLKENNQGAAVYHLSTAMCAAHRNQILQKIREHLKVGNKIICISTQLIEAGVDVSFECVIRSLAGLDSIAQAAGRCNRHGEKEIQPVYIIDHEEEKLNKLEEIKEGKKVAKKILIDLKHDQRKYGGHILSEQAMEKYFKEYYTGFELSLNYFIPRIKKDMMELLTVAKGNYSYHKAYCSIHKHSVPLFIVNSYRTAAENFHVIENHTSSVFVPYGEGKEIISECNGLSKIEDFSRLLKRAQHYTINLYDYEQRLLEQNNGLVSLLDGKILALREGAYHDEFGFNLENNSPLEFLQW